MSASASALANDVFYSEGLLEQEPSNKKNSSDEWVKKSTEEGGQKDVYPSRKYSLPTYINRKDPVIYSTDLKAPLEEALLDQYEKKGFLFLDHLFEDHEIADMQKHMQCLRDSEVIKQREESITEVSSGDIRSVFDVHKLGGFFQKIAHHTGRCLYECKQRFSFG